MASTLTSKFYTTSSGTELHCLEGGDPKGTPLICLHGLGGSVNTFTALAPSLPKQYKIVLVDFPGFGQTKLRSETEPLQISGHVADIHDLVAHLQGDSDGVAQGRKVAFIGHSLGTIVALHYTAQHPDTVAGLALLGTGRSASHIEAVRQIMLNTASNTRKNGIDATAAFSSTNNFPSAEKRATPSEHIEEVRQAVAASDQEGYAKTCEMIADPAHKDPEYAKIKCPAVLVAGDMDVISPVQRSKDISALLGGPTELVVVESGHQPLISAPEATTAAILGLLAKI